MIIRSKDEADRLRLTLSSLIRQGAHEVVVVDDGSSDHTQAVIDEASSWAPLKTIHHPAPRGRSAASNAGARAADGDILLFLDGDTLAGPGMIAGHMATHAGRRGLVGRGETFNLRCTRWLADPETCRPHPEHAEHIAQMGPAELQRCRVTRAQVLDDFASIERRAQPGVYPGAGPRRLYELEMDALRNHPGCSMLWSTACGSNLSMERRAFLDVGGFNDDIDMIEQRELAYRLCAGGAQMVPVTGRSYHLTHRLGWRDPLADLSWEETFLREHGDPSIRLLLLLWAHQSPVAAKLPPEARIESLPALEAAARGGAGVDYEAARRIILSAYEMAT